MKKLLCLVVAFLMIASVAMAADGYPGRSFVRTQTASVSTCAHVTTSPALVYQMVLTANTAAGWGALIDSAQTGSYSSTLAFVEAKEGTSKYKAFVGQATQYATTTVTFDPPLYFEEGIFFYDGFGTDQVSGGDGARAIITYANVSN